MPLYGNNPASLNQSHWSRTAQSSSPGRKLEHLQADGFLVLSRTDLLFMRVQALV